MSKKLCSFTNRRGFSFLILQTSHCIYVSSITKLFLYVFINTTDGLFTFMRLQKLFCSKKAASSRMYLFVAVKTNTF